MKRCTVELFEPAHLVGVVHAHGNTLALEVVDIERGWRTTISWTVDELQLPSSGNDKVGGTVLPNGQHGAPLTSGMELT